jgi:hypothetical protein
MIYFSPCTICGSRDRPKHDCCGHSQLRGFAPELLIPSEARALQWIREGMEMRAEINREARKERA